ncbi:aminotransferase class I/II-fold pyridoxal phosphate-dependent enzyme [Bacillus gobiensis]|uniref:aminotransferase class I/II-fold pyridoxal phosphate-dependent enzyme n=1 Tax=Bacillus gobiensis TaxID=1441095 RepID=UPI003D1FF019
MKTPLFHALLRHVQSNPYSFHVPGHHNGDVFFDKARPFYDSLLALDLTEIEGLDDLHHPEGVIKEAQELAAKLYGACETFFLVNGSTVGNLAMILASCQQGDTILVQRNCHKSVFHAVEMAGAYPVYLSPEIDLDMKLPTHVSEETLNRAMSLYPEAKAIVLTNPTYYGHVTDLAPSIKEAHRRGIPVLVDEAHGAHFVLGKPFPLSSLQMGADVVVHSAHKTLPAMTMGSYLHLNSDRINRERIAYYLSILQSSSPSYPIMASLDLARAYLDEIIYSNQLEAIVKDIASFHGLFADMQHVEIKKPTDPSIQTDPLKLAVQSKCGHTGYELKELFEAADVHPEMADEQFVLFVLPMEKNRSISKVRFQAIDKEVERTRRQGRKALTSDQPSEKITELAYDKEILASFKKEPLSLEKTIGRVCAGPIIPYPPGVPLLLPGERIIEEKAEILKRLIDQKARIQGNGINHNYQLLVYIEEETP